MRSVFLIGLGLLLAQASLANPVDPTDAVADAYASDVAQPAQRVLSVTPVTSTTNAATSSDAQWRPDTSGCGMRFRGSAEIIAHASRTVDQQGQIRCIWYIHHTGADQLSIQFQAAAPHQNAFHRIALQQANGLSVGPRWNTPMASATAVRLPRTVIVSVTPTAGHTGQGLDLVAH